MGDLRELFLRFSQQDTESVISDSFYSHHRHFFVVTDTGKPVFSRYGDVMLLSTLLGAFSALVSLTMEGGNELEIEGDTRKIFIDGRGPFVFITVGPKDETFATLQQFHEYFEKTIYVYVPLQSFLESLAVNPAYDCRQLIYENSVHLKMAIYKYGTWMGGLVGSLSVAYCGIRNEVSEVINSVIGEGNGGINSDIIMVLLHDGNQVICCNGRKGFCLTPSDMNGVITYTSHHPGDGEVGMPLLSKSGKLKVWTVECGILKLVVIYQKLDYFLEVKIITENLNHELDKYYNSIIAFINNPPVPDLYTTHYLMFYTFISESSVYSSPLSGLYQTRKDKKRLLKMCQKIYFECKDVDEKNKPTTKSCVFSTELETVTALNTNKGMLICVYNFIVDIPTAIKYTDEVNKWMNYENITFKQITEG
ncbi:hypothetical protein EIN_176750 [Entamoeba invadens IP1]|uniref:hypothetical protein n=1 Tax=Entamoeba invadens IP1 TaxID=370355 RepID=UPI0002C3ECA2|nr:hypothetical protein EIN_176750 [Entamoeba invadens IP1]ELP93848.1 hypothetical protein EIN_176750 [Entamoeba invadens IP1]|eukprot:XP_004260619.1 hypothetical protein EIN_176750 [Entamoeba invadens IP1]